MTIKELEKKLAELEKLQAETENAHAKLKAQIAELKALREELPKPPHPRWKPERDEHYYTIDIGGACAGWETWDSDNFDGDIYSLGFVYKTDAETEFAIERLKVIAEMREWAGRWNDGYTISVDSCDNTKIDVFDRRILWPSGEMRFASRKDAENCIKAVGEDRIKKYYFMIPEDVTR